MSERTPVQQRHNEAFDLLKQGKHAEARLILEEIVAEDSADAAVLETLGDVREKLGDKDGALDAYAGAVTHLRARGEHKRALNVVELMLIVDEGSLASRKEAAELRLELDDEVGCWREVVAGCEVALGRSDGKADVRAVVALCESLADSLPDAAPGLAVARRLEGYDRAAAARLCRTLGDALRRRGKPEEARLLASLAIDIEPALKDTLHARAVPADERSEGAWSERTPDRAPAVPLADDDDDPKDQGR